MNQIKAFLRLPTVAKLTGMAPSSIYQAMSEGSFPKPVPIGDRRVAWIESEVAVWQAERIAERDNRVTKRGKIRG